MTPDAIQTAARLLIEARRTRKLLAALPENVRPQTADEGYQVQKAVIAGFGETIAGWKAGATALPIQQRFGLTEPFFGPIFAPTVMTSPATAKASTFEHRPDVATPGIALEVEFAFRVARDLAPKAGGRSEAEVLDAIEAMIPAFEIISPRYHAIPFATPGQALADCGVNGGIILGAPVTDWRAIDYPNHRTAHLIDGKVAAEGTGALVLGHPFKSLHWVVNAVTQRGYTIAKGQVLTTGSMSGIVTADQGTRNVADFGRLGQVELTVA